jgi:ribosomal protein S18 acetylase RimI-like enzyme
MLSEALHLAATWRAPGTSRGVEDLLADPALSLYVEGWPRPGDFGVIAEEGGVPIGAAWYRTFAPNRHGYGFIDRSTPEITLGVRAAHRRRGLATELMRALIEHARAEHIAALSLSVEEDNPAVSLYQRLGFETVSRVDNAWTMRLELGQAISG